MSTLTSSPPVDGATIVEDLHFDAPPRPKAVVRFSLINPDQRWVMIVAIVVFAAIILAALLSSFTAMYAVSAGVGLPMFARALPAVFLDSAILGYTWALIVFKRRGRYTGWARLGLIISTGLSVAANSVHTLMYWDGVLTSYEAVLGIVISGLIPLLALLATEVLIRLVFDNPDKSGAVAKEVRS